MKAPLETEEEKYQKRLQEIENRKIFLQQVDPDGSKHKRYVELSWKILEAKYMYYIKDKPFMQDYDYDIMEKEYDSLCDELQCEKSASNMVGFDMNRWSCKTVAEKMERQLRRKRKKK